MTDWNSLLDWLASGPRENGSAALHDTAMRLLESLRGLGLDAAATSYTAYPYRLRIAGIVILIGAALYARFSRDRRWRAALTVACVLPVILLIELEAYIPLFGWPGMVEQHNVEALIPAARPDPVRHVILAAHFDSKTDYLDHVERAPIEFLAFPIVLLMALAAGLGLRGRDWPRLAVAARAAGYTYGIGAFLAFTAGAFVSARSHGAIDDGAACTVLVRLAERLREVPLQHTNVTVLFLSGEEIGVQGSWHYARRHFATAPSLPTSVINLEGLGLTSDLAVLGKESFALRSYQPDPTLFAAADAAHRYMRQKPLWRTWYGGGTDARSFFAHGIPAMTLISDPPGHPLQRHLHSRFDSRALVQNVALESHRELLEATLRELETPTLNKAR